MNIICSFHCPAFLLPDLLKWVKLELKETSPLLVKICTILLGTFLQPIHSCIPLPSLAAARVATYLMLQEDFGGPLTQALVLASCYRYITSEDKQPWEDYTPKVEEPKEEVRVQVLCSTYLIYCTQVTVKIFNFLKIHFMRMATWMLLCWG